MTPKRLSLLLFGIMAALVLTGMGLFIIRDQQRVAADANRDAAITALTTDANKYRSALQNKGVNPSSIAPPPATRVEQVTGDPGQPGAPGERGLPGATGPKGDTGATGAQGAAGAQGDPGVEGQPGKDGTNGTNGADGRGISSTSVTQSGDTCTMTVTYTDGTSQSAGSWSCPAAAPPPATGSAPMPVGVSALGLFALIGAGRPRVAGLEVDVLPYLGRHRRTA
jgi:hypothetical protein